MKRLAMILNRQAALERIEQDLELYEEICGIFSDDAPTILIDLKQSLNNRDIPAATRHAHSLKSAAANIGAIDLCETARLAENSFRAGDIKNSYTMISNIEQNLLLVLEALK